MTSVLKHASIETNVVQSGKSTNKSERAFDMKMTVKFVVLAMVAVVMNLASANNASAMFSTNTPAMMRPVRQGFCGMDLKDAGVTIKSTQKCENIRIVEPALGVPLLKIKF